MEALVSVYHGAVAVPAASSLPVDWLTWMTLADAWSININNRVMKRMAFTMTVR
jgi:hypothetical protein